ncbi:MAG TPA: chemotaxis protein CheB [Tepidisphaeraceae bacterium]|jgi:two-component system chemotaxis response regulator CheB
MSQHENGTASSVVAIGGSVGAIPVLRQILRELPVELPAAVVVVLHQHQNGPRILPAVLGDGAVLPIAYAEEGQSIEPGRVYLAPPDRHVLIEGRHLHVTAGPKENGHRPAIDPLFRTAAQAYGPTAVGGILSGDLDDGIVGLIHLHRAGGYAIVQDPQEAVAPSMPATAMAYAHVDAVLRAAEISRELVRHVRELWNKRTAAEAKVIANPNPSLSSVGGPATQPVTTNEAEPPGPPSAFTCPSCGGAIWEITEGGTARYRCHVGHSYGQDSFVAQQSDNVESALYAAMRLLRDQANLYRRVAGRAHAGLNPLVSSSDAFRERAEQADQKAETLRKLLLER